MNHPWQLPGEIPFGPEDWEAVGQRVSSYAVPERTTKARQLHRQLTKLRNDSAELGLVDTSATLQTALDRLPGWVTRSCD